MIVYPSFKVSYVEDISEAFGISLRMWLLLCPLLQQRVDCENWYLPFLAESISLSLAP